MNCFHTDKQGDVVNKIITLNGKTRKLYMGETRSRRGMFNARWKVLVLWYFMPKLQEKWAFFLNIFKIKRTIAVEHRCISSNFDKEKTFRKVIRCVTLCICINKISYRARSFLVLFQFSIWPCYLSVTVTATAVVTVNNGYQVIESSQQPGKRGISHMSFGRAYLSRSSCYKICAKFSLECGVMLPVSLAPPYRRPVFRESFSVPIVFFPCFGWLLFWRAFMKPLSNATIIMLYNFIVCQKSLS